MVTNDVSEENDLRNSDRTTAELDLQPPTFRIVSRDIIVQKAFQHENSLRSLTIEPYWAKLSDALAHQSSHPSYVIYIACLKGQELEVPVNILFSYY